MTQAAVRGRGFYLKVLEEEDSKKIATPFFLPHGKKKGTPLYVTVLHLTSSVGNTAHDTLSCSLLLSRGLPLVMLPLFTTQGVCIHSTARPDDDTDSSYGAPLSVEPMGIINQWGLIDQWGKQAVYVL